MTNEDAKAGATTVAFCGPGGTGASTLAIAFAQQCGGTRVLADLCRNAEQGVLHDAGDVGPGIQELVDQCRSSRPDTDQVLGHTYGVTERGYALLLGLRRASAWPALRPRAVAGALDALTSTFTVVVCDCDGDVEGQAEGGSLDVEERNVMARSAISRAVVVFTVGLPGLKGTYSLAKLIGQLADGATEPGRILPVFNRVSRGPRTRARLASALAALLPDDVRQGVPTPLFIPDRDHDVERALHDRTRLPAALGDPLVSAFGAVRSVQGDQGPAAGLSARRVEPGELGAWRDEVHA